MKPLFYVFFFFWMTTSSLSMDDEKWPLNGCNEEFDHNVCVSHLYCIGYRINDINHKTPINNMLCPENYKLRLNHNRLNNNMYYGYEERKKVPFKTTVHFKTRKTEQESMIPLQEGSFENYQEGIVYLDVSNNEIVNFPTFSFMPNLEKLNFSRNFLTNAKLSNPTIRNMDKLNEIDFSYNAINTIIFSDNEKLFLELKILNLSHNEINYVTDGIFEKFNEITTLDISFNKINLMNALTFDGLKDMIYLYLAHNKITSINSSLLKLDKLIELDLSYNEIEEAKNDDFRKLSYLKNLNLSHNRLKIIGSDVFNNLFSLLTLDLNKNLIETIDKIAFVNITQLKIIDLSQNNLKTLPRDIFKANKAIKMLTINKNKLDGTVWKGTFEGLENVAKLNLSYQYLAFIEDFAFFGLEKVETLLLNNNKIQNLSKNSLKSLKKLSFLDLSNNQISSLGFVKEDLVSLLSLNLQCNSLSKVKSEDFLGLSRLITLDLSKNKIYQIEPNCFKYLTELNNFKFSNNPISGPLEENSFNGLSALPALDISDSMLSKINNGSFEGLKSMKELNISNSELDEIQFNSFSGTGALEVLDISFNKLNTFHVNTTYISNIRQLIISNNFITTIASDTFKGLSHLTKLILFDNFIESIHNDALIDLQDLCHFDLSLNPKLHFDFKLLRNAQALKKLVLSNMKAQFSFVNVVNNSLTDLEMSNSGILDIKLLGIYKLIQLNSLALTKNEIAKLELGAFANLTDLRNLDLSYNKITFIQPGVFKDNTLLYLLNISHNAINTIGYGVFAGLKYLHTIDMSYNNIDNLDSERFYEVTGLTVLIADYNRINSFRDKDFTHTSLSSLSIGGNPIPCDLLAKLDKSSVAFSITAITLDVSKENFHGVTCNIDDGRIFYNSANFSTKEKILYDIRDILLNMSSIKVTEKHLATENHSKYFNDIMNVMEKSNSGLTGLLNLMVTGNNKTNNLLNKLTNTITSINNIRRSEPIPISKENSNVDLIPLINKMKQDLEDTIAIEKQSVLNEVDKKMSLMNVNNDVSLIKSTNPNHKALSDTEKSENSFLFMEVCVGIIFVTMIAFALYKLYISGIFIPRRSSANSTRNLQDATDDSVL